MTLSLDLDFSPAQLVLSDFDEWRPALGLLQTVNGVLAKLQQLFVGGIAAFCLPLFDIGHILCSRNHGRKYSSSTSALEGIGPRRPELQQVLVAGREVDPGGAAAPAADVALGLGDRGLIGADVAQQAEQSFLGADGYKRADRRERVVRDAMHRPDPCVLLEVDEDPHEVSLAAVV